MTKVDKTVDAEDQLTASAFHTYVYLVKAGKPDGPREVMRGANLTSPSVAYRNLQKLIDIGLVIKDEYGNYVVKEKVGLKGYVWLGKTIVPRFVVFGFVFGLPTSRKQTARRTGYRARRHLLPASLAHRAAQAEPRSRSAWCA